MVLSNLPHAKIKLRNTSISNKKNPQLSHIEVIATGIGDSHSQNKLKDKKVKKKRKL